MIEFPVPTNYTEFLFGHMLAAMPHVPGLAERVLRSAGAGRSPASPYALQHHLYDSTGKELHGKRGSLGGDLSAYPVLDCSQLSPIEVYREILRHLQKGKLDLTRWAGDEGSVLGLFFR